MCCRPVKVGFSSSRGDRGVGWDKELDDGREKVVEFDGSVNGERERERQAGEAMSQVVESVAYQAGSRTKSEKGSSFRLVVFGIFALLLVFG